MRRKFDKVLIRGFISMRADRQTDRQTRQTRTLYSYVDADRNARNPSAT